MRVGIGPLGSTVAWLGMLATAGCAGQGHETIAPVDAPSASESPRIDRGPWRAREPLIPPRIAMLAGFLPTSAIGADTFLLNNPQYDGRGVLIGILDSGIDPKAPGLMETSTGTPKVLDLRDFSGEGHVRLVELVPPRGDTIVVGGMPLAGFGRVARLASSPYYGGVLRERTLGVGPTADLNGNGSADDDFPLVVARSSGGWFVMVDANRDGSLRDEMVVRDYLVARETLAFGAGGPAGRLAPITVAANLAEDESGPDLAFVFDNSGHGTHVAGIASGYRMFGVDGFNGVAPGAQLLGLKISNNARGSISVTGSMRQAMEYAAESAERRGMPLVLNLSFGIGNDSEGSATIDSIVDAFALDHPDVLLVMSAGNYGPGLSSIDVPASSEHALSVCALFPGVFAELPRPGTPSPEDVLAAWSARGGEVAKPDVCAPGKAFATVPAFRSGHEIAEGTSMAAPQIAGAAALLQSSQIARGRRARAVDLTHALKTSAIRPPGMSRLDVGWGVPNVSTAFQWLYATHQTGVYAVRALPDGGNSSRSSAAFRRAGLASPADTLQRFAVESVGGQPAARLLLRADVDWIRAPAYVEPRGGPTNITLVYDRETLGTPGLHVGTVEAFSATDTLAGPLFALLNTVITPHEMDDPLVSATRVGPGRTKRYFVDVPDGAGGLQARMTLKPPFGQATLYLFEPGGLPARATYEAVAGGDHPSSATLSVRAEDAVPGVYEVVVVAPSTSEAFCEVEVRLPLVEVMNVGAGPYALVRNRSMHAQHAAVSADLIGARQSVEVRAARGTAGSVELEPPAWAERMEIAVALSGSEWNKLTDFGLTIFDSTGRKVADAPLHYATDRHAIRLDTLDYRGALSVELLPAYAHTSVTGEWTAAVELSFELPEARRLSVADSAEQIDLDLGPRETGMVELQIAPDDVDLGEGLWPLIEVTARSPGSLDSVRRTAVTRFRSTGAATVPTPRK